MFEYPTSNNNQYSDQYSRMFYTHQSNNLICFRPVLCRWSDHRGTFAPLCCWHSPDYHPFSDTQQMRPTTTSESCPWPWSIYFRTVSNIPDTTEHLIIGEQHTLSETNIKPRGNGSGNLACLSRDSSTLYTGGNSVASPWRSKRLAGVTCVCVRACVRVSLCTVCNSMGRLFEAHLVRWTKR